MAQARAIPNLTMTATPKTAAAKTSAKGKGAAKQRELTPRQQRFVEEYVKSLNATQAAISAGYSPKTAQEQSSRLLSNVMVASAIQAHRAEVSAEAKIDAADVLRHWATIATTDPRELVQYVRRCCRYCWGIGHAYQWTPGGLLKAQADAVAKDKAMPDASGGTGFKRNRDPNPECPECGGDGYGDVVLTDSRKLTPAGALLLAGYKEGKDGLEVKLRDRDAALANLAKHLGMFPSRVELTGKDGGPVQHQALPADLSNLSDDELSNLEAIAAKLGQSPGPGDDPG